MTESLIIETIKFKPTDTGKKRYLLKTSKGFISCWDEELAKQLAPGTYEVDLSYSPDGKFCNLLKVHALLSGGSSKTQSHNSSPDEQRLIVRQSCLKAAVEMWSSMDRSAYAALLTKGTVEEIKAVAVKGLTEIAEEFEQWVYRE